MASRKKLLTSAIALGTAAALTLGGTFAWQSISQKALNEASDIVNPGGRLHDDFDGANKDVYVENFAEDDIFARVRLEEFFEIVVNYGVEGVEKTIPMIGSKTAKMGEDGNPVTTESGNPVYDYIYITFKNYSAGYTADAGNVDGTSWWSWDMGGDTVFMPTFNKNKDSLQADINGEYKFDTGVITSKDIDGGQYTTMKTWAEGDKENGSAIYDADSNKLDEVGDNFDNLDAYVTARNIKLVEEEHTAKTTPSGMMMSMEDWLDAVDANGYVEGYDTCWVYDTDGWVYWSAPIKAGEATGKLLDGIELNQVMDDTWYYAINVVAQFCTADDVGKANNTGFYADGESVSKEAEKLLKTIGVELDENEKKALTISNPTLTETYNDVCMTADVLVNGSAAADTDENAVDVYLLSGVNKNEDEPGLTGTIKDGTITITTSRSNLIPSLTNSVGLGAILDLKIGYTDGDGEKLISNKLTFKYAEALTLSEEGAGSITLTERDMNRIAVSYISGEIPEAVIVKAGDEWLTSNSFSYYDVLGLLVIDDLDCIGKTLTIKEPTTHTVAAVDASQDSDMDVVENNGAIKVAMTVSVDGTPVTSTDGLSFQVWRESHLVCTVESDDLQCDAESGTISADLSKHDLSLDYGDTTVKVYACYTEDNITVSAVGIEYTFRNSAIVLATGKMYEMKTGEKAILQSKNTSVDIWEMISFKDEESNRLECKTGDSENVNKYYLSDEACIQLEKLSSGVELTALKAGTYYIYCSDIVMLTVTD